jgi:hypothetical protein
VDNISAWMARLMHSSGFEDDAELLDEAPDVRHISPVDGAKTSLLDQLPALKDRVANGPSPTAIAISAASLRSKVGFRGPLSTPRYG